MSKLIFPLRSVPDDEAQEIRALLTENHIHFYETTAGNWGISMPGIWLHQEDDFPNAKELIDQYQQNRAIAARKEFALQKSLGLHTTLVDRIAKQPIKIIFYCLLVALILFLSLQPFLSLI